LGLGLLPAAAPGVAAVPSFESEACAGLPRDFFFGCVVVAESVAD
jgi:hypothetical protein